jgi:transcriptional regulator with XRE-family HTH domain
MIKPNVLRWTRLEAAMSQAELAKASGVFQPRISLFERELAQPTAKEKQKLALALGVSEDRIFPEEK